MGLLQLSSKTSQPRDVSLSLFFHGKRSAILIKSFHWCPTLSSVSRSLTHFTHLLFFCQLIYWLSWSPLSLSLQCLLLLGMVPPILSSFKPENPRIMLDNWFSLWYPSTINSANFYSPAHPIYFLLRPVYGLGTHLYFSALQQKLTPSQTLSSPVWFTFTLTPVPNIAIVTAHP